MAEVVYEEGSIALINEDGFAKIKITSKAGFVQKIAVACGETFTSRSGQSSEHSSIAYEEWIVESNEDGSGMYWDQTRPF